MPSSPAPPSSSPRSSNADLPAGHFLNLPGELRNDIYRHYLRREGGYVYNHDTANLTTTCPDESLEIALQFTCRQVYNEMFGMALSINTIHFYPVESEKHRITAARFQSLCSLVDRRLEQLIWPRYLFHTYISDSVKTREEYEEEEEAYRKDIDEKLKNDQLCYDEDNAMDNNLLAAIDEDPRIRNIYREPEVPAGVIPLLTQKVKDEVVRDFPEMQHLLVLEPIGHVSSFRPTEPVRFWGTGHMADSSLRKAMLHTVQVAVDQGCFTGAVAACARTILALSSKYQRWDIPRLSQVDEFLETLQACGALNRFDSEMGPWGSDYWSRPGLSPFAHDYGRDRKNIFGKHRYSAAAAAIHFLKSLPRRLRNHVSAMVLHEDQTAISTPQCHGLGFIPFCLDNPALRIERRVHLWKNVLLLIPNTRWPFAEIVQPYEDYPRPSDAIAALERWISEALALEAAGMPRASFSMVLDGDEGHDEHSHIFETLRVDAVNMLAADAALAETPDARLGQQPGWNKPFYTFDNWPQAVQDIVDGASIVRCDFPMKPDLITIEEVLKNYGIYYLPTVHPARMKARGSRNGQYLGNLGPHRVGPGYPGLKVPPALGSWTKLLEDNLTPEFFTSGEQELLEDF